MKNALLGGQMLFVAFGSLVLVPVLTGLDPSLALLGAGVGTLLFQLVTKRQVPIFLASSFAFIAPLSFGIAEWGLPATMGGMMCAGLVYLALGGLIKVRGVGIVQRLLPPVVVGPVIMVIGLNLAPVAVSYSLGQVGGDQANWLNQTHAMIVAAISLTTTICFSLFGKGIFRLIPILAGITTGYIAAMFFGFVDFTPIREAAWLSMPNFVTPEFNLAAILYILPVAIAPAIEHVGDMLAISNVAGKDFVKKPGLHRTMMGDGIATIAASMMGAPPNTTYSEVTGAVMLTKAFNPVIMTWTAITAIVLAFVGKLGAFLQTIPEPVMGGIMLLLFGSIASVGMNSLIKHHIDLSNPRNMIIVSVTLVFGIGGMKFGFGGFELGGVGLCGILAIILNLVLPKHFAEQNNSGH
uniref:uracil-xanthine permease family protein n=1 Tax=Thaumasiovibrio occultus TaxID=1891184 RepID=UPI000B35EA2B|nr:uracil-xanthine permease family protein [Thaumasiovibrio occultus]